MQKLNNTNKIILKILLSVILCTISSVTILTFLSSYIILKLDLSTEYCIYFTYCICAIVSFLVPICSLKSLKNNGIIIGILSNSPIMILTLINTFINDNKLTDLFVKLIIIVIISSFSGLLKTRQNRKFKVK